MIELLAKQYDTKVFNVSDYLTKQNRTLSDVEDVVFLVKDRQTTTDTDAIITKTISNESITIDSGRVYVRFTPADFATNKLVGGEKYVYGLGFKFPEMDVLLEPKIVNIDGSICNFITILNNFVNKN